MSDSQPSTEPEPTFESQTSTEPRPSFTLNPRPSLLRFLTEHNPFYLLSAACMLASCLALTNSLSWTSIAPSRLLTLIVTLNVYEAAVLTIALFLIKRRGLRRDGRILLILQAFFLADFSFLGAEIATADVHSGAAINAGLLVLAAVKLAVVIGVLKPSFTVLQYLFLIVQLAVLYTTPVTLRMMDADGNVNARQFYVVWWIVGLLPALYEALRQIEGERVVSVSPTAASTPTTAYLVLPYVSLLVHLGILHWVYQVDYVGANAAPMLLGLTVVLNRFSPSWVASRKDLAALRLLLPAAAIMVSANNPFVFASPISDPRLTLTPLNLAVAGAFFAYVFCFLRPHARLALAAGAAALAVYVLGPTWQQTVAFLEATWLRATTLAEEMRPKTTSDWGLVGLVASFAFLALGFWMSLRKYPDTPSVTDG